ncbi:diguanylate cyclase domain-containing protein [Micromonosporaceae bacterium Da 78-11]
MSSGSSWPHAGSVSAVLLTDAAHLGPFLIQSAGVPPLALFTALVALGTRRQEQASARERVIAQVGTTLATTADPELIYRTATEAAHQMLAHDDAWAALSVPAGGGEQRVTAFAGAAPAELAGAVLHPEQVTTRLGAEVLPLRTDQREYGSLIVYAGGNQVTQARSALRALAGQTVLGLVNAENAASLRHQAFHDALTGLANRALLRENLDRAYQRARRGAAQAVLLMDLDGFKGVNDTYGHALGDLLLVNVAQRLSDAVRGADTAARLGGDEFAVILDSMELASDAVVVAQRILALVQAPLIIDGVDLTPRASMGVATFDDHRSAEAWLHEADTAMYAAKTAGKGCVGHLDERQRPVIVPPARSAGRVV